MSIAPLGPIEAKTFALSPAARREISTPAALISATLIGQIVPGEDQAIGAEGVGQNDPAAGLDVGPCDRFHRVRMAEVPGIGTGPDRQASRLELRAPRAVGDDGTVGQKVFECGVH